MSEKQRNVVLALMAHPDDAEILCAGTLIRLADIGWEIHIATMTPGDCGSAKLSAAEISAIRQAEARKSAAMIGAAYHGLDERDGFVVYDKATLRKTVDFFRRIAPSVVLAHARRDYMMDHEQACLLARAASFAYSAPNISELPPVPGSRVPHLYYCDPIGGREPTGGMVTPTCVVRITKQLEKKLAMLACHASQIEWLRQHNKSDDIIEMVRLHAIDRGRLAGAVAAEAFVQHLSHGYPDDDLLRETLA